MAAISAQRSAAFASERGAAKANRARRRRIEPRQQAGHRCFAAAAFAHQRDGATGTQGQRDIFDGFHAAWWTKEPDPSQRELFAQMERFQDRRVLPRFGGWRRRGAVPTGGGLSKAMEKAHSWVPFAVLGCRCARCPAWLARRGDAAG